MSTLEIAENTAAPERVACEHTDPTEASRDWRNLSATNNQSENAKLKFGPTEGFLRTIRQRVDEYFQSSGLRPRDCVRMYFKTAIILAWFFASYFLLVFAATTWWHAVLLTVSAGLAASAIGFNIQHDGGHQAYSKSRKVNRMAAATLDMLGGSSYMWDQKHNVIHHTYANITGYDDDIDLGALGRLSPHQKRFKFHRMQHFYLWFLYGFIVAKWHVFDDFRDYLRAKIGGQKFRRPKGWDLALFVGGKVFFLAMAIVVPMIWHPWWVVLSLYGLATFVQGLMLSVVFQLAHCVEEAEFPMPTGDPKRMENEWAIHQIETTVDFARGSRVVSWFVGGLNFQIEHHLFPRICHIHYPAISKVVEQTCEEYGIRYRSHDKLLSSIGSHYRWLKEMGRPVKEDSDSTPALAS